MLTVGAYEAKTKLSHLLARVANGERIVITKHGVPVAILAPFPHTEKRDTKEVIAEIEAFGKKHSLNGLKLRDLIEEGRI